MTVKGTFPAGQDLYLYGFNCPADGGTWSAVHMYALYSGTYCTKVTGGTEIIGTASTIALTGGVLGSPVKIQITRDNADFVHTLKWSFAGHSGTIAAKTGDTIVSWTPNANTFGAYIPTASSGTLTVSCTTYYGSEQIGTAQTATLTLSVPSDAAPTVSSGWASVSYSNSGTAAEGIAACIAGYSKATVVFDSTKVTAKYGATVKTLTAKLGGSTVTGSGTIGTVSGTSNTVTLTATDSRGKKTSQKVTLSAYAYSKPVLGGVTVFRCSSAGAEDDGGAYYSAKATVTYSTAGGKISCTLTAAIKAVGGSYGTATALTPGKASVLGGGLSATVSYIVRIRAVDTLGNAAVVEVMIPTAAVAFHIPDGGNGLGLGKYNEADGYVDSAWPLKMNGNRIADFVESSTAYNVATNEAITAALDETVADMVSGDSRRIVLRVTATGLELDGGWWFVDILFQSANYVYAIANQRANAGSQEMRNGRYGSAAWTGWAWVQPPMNVGVEYRTTERYNGKPVYTKLIDFGTLPNATWGTIQITIVNYGTLISCDGVMKETGGKSTSPIPRNSKHAAYNNVGLAIRTTGTQSAAIVISTDFDASGYTATLRVKYTKSTD